MSRSLEKEKKFQTKVDIKGDNVVLGSAAVGSDNDDNVMLIKMGYKPQLRREFNYLSAFGQAWGSQGLAPSIAGSLIFALGS